MDQQEEPPHASGWQAVRERCEREPVEFCGWPWCRCEPAMSSTKPIEAAGRRGSEARRAQRVARIKPPKSTEQP
jgi:hypothetical protein